jgi:hypothetical protein
MGGCSSKQDAANAVSPVETRQVETRQDCQAKTKAEACQAEESQATSESEVQTAVSGSTKERPTGSCGGCGSNFTNPEASESVKVAPTVEEMETPTVEEMETPVVKVQEPAAPAPKRFYNGVEITGDNIHELIRESRKQRAADKRKKREEKKRNRNAVRRNRNNQRNNQAKNQVKGSNKELPTGSCGGCGGRVAEGARGMPNQSYPSADALRILNQPSRHYLPPSDFPQMAPFVNLRNKHPEERVIADKLYNLAEFEAQPDIMPLSAEQIARDRHSQGYRDIFEHDLEQMVSGQAPEASREMQEKQTQYLASLDQAIAARRRELRQPGSERAQVLKQRIAAKVALAGQKMESLVGRQKTQEFMPLINPGSGQQGDLQQKMREAFRQRQQNNKQRQLNKHERARRVAHEAITSQERVTKAKMMQMRQQPPMQQQRQQPPMQQQRMGYYPQGPMAGQPNQQQQMRRQGHAPGRRGRH